LDTLRSDFGSQLGDLVDRSVLLLDGLSVDRRTDPVIGATSCLEILPPYAGG
jgi:hypothetical protein